MDQTPLSLAAALALPLPQGRRAAHGVHRFEDFAVWVVFYGPVKIAGPLTPPGPAPRLAAARPCGGRRSRRRARL
jgi:hypothetical protein